MKTILVSLAHLDRLKEAVKAAITIARQNDGHIIGYYPIPAPSILYVAPGMDYPMDNSSTLLYEERLPEIKESFEDQMQRAGVKYEWREDRRQEPRLTKGIIEHGRQADVIILAHEAAGSKFASEEADFIADIILGAGRPVLAMPPLNSDEVSFDRVAIAWNATKESCRAAFDALPLLSESKDVYLTWINPEKTPDKAGKLPGAELASALARHDVDVTVKGLSNRNRTAKALINYVNEDNIDLLVMGAYGHSRLREQILGGVTHHILKNLPCPVLFAN